VRDVIKDFGPEGISGRPVIVVPGSYVVSMGAYPVKAMNAKSLVGFLLSARPIYEVKQLTARAVATGR
jgi:hypothetical protein